MALRVTKNVGLHHGEKSQSVKISHFKKMKRLKGCRNNADKLGNKQDCEEEKWTTEDLSYNFTIISYCKAALKGKLVNGKNFLHV